MFINRKRRAGSFSFSRPFVSFSIIWPSRLSLIVYPSLTLPLSLTFCISLERIKTTVIGPHETLYRNEMEIGRVEEYWLGNNARDSDYVNIFLMSFWRMSSISLSWAKIGNCNFHNKMVIEISQNTHWPFVSYTIFVVSTSRCSRGINLSSLFIWAFFSFSIIPR